MNRAIPRAVGRVLIPTCGQFVGRLKADALADLRKYREPHIKRKSESQATTTSNALSVFIAGSTSSSPHQQYPEPDRGGSPLT
jgi:hypothetical protein